MSRKPLELTTKLICIALSVLLFISAIQHFVNYENLDEHYRSVSLGTSGRIAVGVLQTIASAGFYFAQTRKYTSLVFALVMSIVITYSFIRPDSHFPVEALCLLLVSVVIFISISRLNKGQS